MIETVIFDMDGVLIDSEPHWREAEKEVFKKSGIHLTDAMCLQTTGLRTDETVAHWYRYRPWNQPSQEAVRLRIEETVCNIINKKGKPAEGLDEIIDFFNNQGIPKALASSASLRVIMNVLEKLGLKKEFKVINSADNEDYGKPHPAVYISTAGKMETLPLNCLAIEDSFAGLLAAKAARMRTIVVPEKPGFDNIRFCIADIKLASLKDFTDEHWKLLNSLNGMDN